MTFTKYLLKKFLPIFFGAIGFFSLVLVLVDLLMNLWRYIAAMASPIDIMRVMLLYFPKTIWYAVPLAVLFACSYTLSDLYAKNELIAIFASGTSLFTFTFPLLLLSLVLSFGLFFFEDYIVVDTFAKKTTLQNVLLKEEVSLNNTDVVVISDVGNTVYKADFYDDTSKKLIGLYVVLRNEDKTLNSIVYAPQAYWENDRWITIDAIQYTSDDNVMSSRKIQGDEILLTELPETFRNNVVNIEEVNTSTARTYIAQLKRAGLPTAESLSQYYKKYAFPFVVFLVVFLSIGLSGKTRKNVLLISLILSVSAAVLFYVSQMVTMLLAKFGYISPLSGAWAPVVLFVFISVVVLRFART